MSSIYAIPPVVPVSRSVSMGCVVAFLSFAGLAPLADLLASEPSVAAQGGFSETRALNTSLNEAEAIDFRTVEDSATLSNILLAMEFQASRLELRREEVLEEMHRLRIIDPWIEESPPWVHDPRRAFVCGAYYSAAQIESKLIVLSAVAECVPRLSVEDKARYFIRNISEHTNRSAAVWIGGKTEVERMVAAGYGEKHPGLVSARASLRDKLRELLETAEEYERLRREELERLGKYVQDLRKSPPQPATFQPDTDKAEYVMRKQRYESALAVLRSLCESAKLLARDTSASGSPPSIR